MTLRVLTLLAAAPLMAQSIRAGREVVKITPPVGIPMAGYYGVRLATGTHDDLYTKALVLESGGVKVALVACDLVAWSARSPLTRVARLRS